MNLATSIKLQSYLPNPLGGTDQTHCDDFLQNERVLACRNYQIQEQLIDEPPLYSADVVMYLANDIRSMIQTLQSHGLASYHDQAH